MRMDFETLVQILGHFNIIINYISKHIAIIISNVWSPLPAFPDIDIITLSSVLEPISCLSRQHFKAPYAFNAKFVETFFFHYLKQHCNILAKRAILECILSSPL